MTADSGKRPDHRLLDETVVRLATSAIVNVVISFETDESSGLSYLSVLRRYRSDLSAGDEGGDIAIEWAQ